MAMAVSNNVRVSPIAVAANPPPSIEVLLVGGGGNGTGFSGSPGTAGGGGGIVYNTAFPITTDTTYSSSIGVNGSSTATSSTFSTYTAGGGGSSSAGLASSGTGATTVLNGRNAGTGNNYASSISGSSVTYAYSGFVTPGSGGSGSTPNPGASPPSLGQSGVLIIAYPSTYDAAVTVTGTYTVSTTANHILHLVSLIDRDQCPLNLEASFTFDWRLQQSCVHNLRLHRLLRLLLCRLHFD
jgi:hypothetical protein